MPGAANLDSIEATIADRGINCDFERTGELDVAVEPWQVDDLRSLHETLLRLGEESELLSAAHTRALVSSPTYLGGSLGWEGRCGVGDSGNQFHYYRLTSDDRLVFGGYDALYYYYYYYGSDLSSRRQRRPETEQKLYRHLLATFPALKGVSINPYLGWRHRHLHPLQRLLAACLWWQGRVGSGVHRAGSRFRLLTGWLTSTSCKSVRRAQKRLA
ncbi:MAG TPA: FAD-dependent oxidoreductase [Dermatophilaceae bacterium]